MSRVFEFKSRRRVIQAIGVNLAIGLAGCMGVGDGSGTPTANDGANNDGTEGGDNSVDGSQTENGTGSNNGSDGSNDQTTTATEDPPASEPVDLEALEIAIRDRANEIRAANGVGELDWDRDLREIARDHSEDMIKNQYFDHVDPMGRDWGDRYQAAGYKCAVQVSGGLRNGGEGIARVNYDDPPSRKEIAVAVVKQLRADESGGGMLATYWDVHGIGVARNPQSDNTVIYVTQNYC